MTEVLDIIGALLLVIGAFFCLAAAVGIVRFPDVLTRMHAATKPQVFGLMVALIGVAISLRTWHSFALCLLVIALQVSTAPTAGHMVGRTAYRTGQWDDEHAEIDELAIDLEQAGFTHRPDDPDPRQPG
ncbi:monovalent cation/H(+) antiporter subunit G [Propioniciclava soli]|uniref:Monovalent cation/H(+) antiporter subunit G n=1 Tax=Propioniciclava soli TaxID=2775081 RepID=A0ABZ3C4Z8_9ACTN|nr:monovalent cation/H(+) antiporter subunit G [Propioniciclava soli]